MGLISVSCALLYLHQGFAKKTNRGGWDTKRSTFSSERHTYFIILLILIGWGIIYFFAIHGILWFLPTEWGGLDEDGNWVTLRSSIAIIISSPIALLTVHKLHKYAENYERLTWLEADSAANKNILKNLSNCLKYNSIHDKSLLLMHYNDLKIKRDELQEEDKQNFGSDKEIKKKLEFAQTEINLLEQHYSHLIKAL
jgi:hypothetical protein